MHCELGRIGFFSADVLSNDDEERVAGVEFGAADVQDLSAAVQRAQATAVSAHVLQGVSGLPRQSQRHLDRGRLQSLSLLSSLPPGKTLSLQLSADAGQLYDNTAHSYSNFLNFVDEDQTINNNCIHNKVH